MQSSDWTYYGLTYAKIFAAFTSLGFVGMWLIGPSPDAEENRKRRKEPKRFDVQAAWRSATGG